MAHGFLQATDLRTERNFLGDIAGAIGNRIGKASDMARRERAYAENIAEKNNTSLSEAGIGRGHFFQRALGSTFGGDAIARTRGRFAKDATMSIDPTGSQASRFRGGFVDRGRYDYSDEIFSAPAERGGALATIFSSGPSVAQKLLDAGPSAINPEVLGGEIAKYQGSPTTNAAGFTVDTTATEIKDIAGILNQIGQLMVRTNNTTIQAVDNVQRVNVKVVESIQSLGQLQVGIAERQIQNQRLLASNAQNTAEKLAARQQASVEKANMAQQRPSSGDLDPEGSGFEGPQGGILGSMFGSLGNILDTGLSLLGGRRGGRRGLGRMSRAGRQAQRRQGFSTANLGDAGIRGKNFRNNSMTGSQLGMQRVMQGKGLAAANEAGNDITKRYAQRYGQKAALKRFGAEGLEAAGMSLTKGARVMRFLSPVLKKVPLVGGLLDFGVSLALGEPIGRAAAKAVGATLGSALGTLVPVPGVGTILGGIAGDLVGGAIYDALAGGSGGSQEGLTPFATGGIITQPTAGLVGEAGTEGVFPLEGAKGRKTFLQFGEGVLEAQKNNKKLAAEIQARGLSEYFDKKPWWKGLLDGLKNFNWNPFARNNNNNDPSTGPRPGASAGSEILDIGEGGGQIQGLSEEDYIQIAKTIAGEAGPGDDQYLVAGAILNRVASAKFPNSVKQVVQAGQYDGGPVQFEGYRANANVDHIVKRLRSPEGQARMVEALNRLEGRTDFKGQTQLHNRVASEDPMFDTAGNFAHFWYQKGPNSVRPSDYVTPDFGRFIKSQNTPKTSPASSPSLNTEAVNDMIEALGGDPDASVNTPTIGPQVKGPLGDLLSASAQVDAQSRAQQLQPLAFTIPQLAQPSSSNDGNQFALGLMTAGSGGMGTDMFTPLSHKIL